MKKSILGRLNGGFLLKIVFLGFILGYFSMGCQTLGDMLGCNNRYYYNSHPGWVDSNNIYYLVDEDIPKSNILDFDRGHDDHNYYIYTMRLDNKEKRQIVKIGEVKDSIDGSGDLHISGISWIGNKIVFSDDNGIWSIDSDGNNKILLSSSGSCPRLSPLGNYIAYVVNYDQGWIMNSDGTNSKKILNFCQFCAPCWFPDESKIIFASTDSIKTVDLNGNIINVINEPYMRDIDISPDGQKLTCVYYKVIQFDYTYYQPYLIVMNVDGSNKNEIYAEYYENPRWGADNIRILGYNCIWGTISYSNFEIALINSDGTGYTKLIDWRDGID